jgi:hypothetical protein
MSTKKAKNNESMERVKKLELIQRSLGIRHKLKVHESMKAPETHEDLAIMLLAKWELEDELRAIENLIELSRAENVASKKELIEQHIVQGKPLNKKKGR